MRGKTAAAKSLREFWDYGAGQNVPRHHRAAADGGSCMWTIQGGTFLARATAVEWETPSAQGVEVPHFAHLVATAGQAPGSGPRNDGGGAWLNTPDPYSGHGLTAMTEDNDRAPFRAVVASGWPLGIVLVALVLLVTACFVTDGGGF